MSEESIPPYLQEEFMSNKIQDTCSSALKQLSRSRLCVWLATFCDVFGAQLCPLTCFCLLFSCISDLGFWTLKEMSRLTMSLGSAHLCGTEKPANVKVLRLGGILTLPYSSQYSTASQDNFNFWEPIFLHISNVLLYISDVWKLSPCNSHGMQQSWHNCSVHSALECRDEIWRFQGS